MMRALTVDTTATRRVAIENSFIAALYDGRFDVGRGRGKGVWHIRITARRYLFNQRTSNRQRTHTHYQIKRCTRAVATCRGSLRCIQTAPDLVQGGNGTPGPYPVKKS